MFKDHPIYGEYFSVSSDGKIYSKRTSKILKTQVLKSGYEVFTTKIGGRAGKSIGFFVHKMVAETWIKNQENKPEVNHIDGNKLNNHVSNLEWVTDSENMTHAYKTGLKIPLYGEDHQNSKFTNEQIQEIKENKNSMSCRSLAKVYGVSHSTISRILNNKRYVNDNG